MQKHGLTEILAAFVADAREAEPSPERIERAKLHLLDTLAAMISGADLPAGRFARELAAAEPAFPRGATAAGGRRVAVETAAFVNAMCAHADETDDAHQGSTTHPGCAVVPAALAVAEARRASGRDLLAAITTGYEICTRIGTVLGSSSFIIDRGFDTHAFGGVFGAATAAASLSALDRAGVTACISLAAHEASGLATVFRDPHHVEKAYVFAGKPARDGVRAAALAAAGLRGVSDPLEGQPGFLSAFGAAPGTTFDDLGRRWAIEETNIKRWCVGSPAQAALDAVEILRMQAAFAPDEIEAVQVALPAHGARVVNNRDMPSINVQHLVALMLNDGGLTFASSHEPARMSDAAVLELRRRVTLRVDDDLTAAEPSRQAIVSIFLKDGRMLRQHIRAVRGTAENPMDRHEVAAKATELMAPSLGSAGTKALLEVVLALEAVDDVGILASLMMPGEAG